MSFVFRGENTRTLKATDKKTHRIELEGPYMNVEYLSALFQWKKERSVITGKRCENVPNASDKGHIEPDKSTQSAN